MFEYDERYSYQDMSDYFTNLSKQKLIKKSTYSVLYHPMLMLAKKYTIAGKESLEVITLNADHIFLLCYLMGYIRDTEGSHSYFGSNATFSKDLGVTVRTIQRRLKELSDVGFIVSVIDNYSERNIYINYEKIFAEITKVIDPKFNSYENILLCHSVVENFILRNFLEKTKLKEYTMYLRLQYLLEISKKNISDSLKFLYETLAMKLGIDFEMIRYDYEKAKMEYIRKINTASENKSIKENAYEQE